MNVRSFNNVTRKIRGDLAIKTFTHHDEVTMYKEILGQVTSQDRLGLAKYG